MVARHAADLPWARGPKRPAAARRSIGQSILLGLELLVAGDIIRSVVVDPTFQSVGVLAVIVLIRTFLSFTLEVEITSRWPWQGSAAVTPTPDADETGDLGPESP